MLDDADARGCGGGLKETPCVFWGWGGCSGCYGEKKKGRVGIQTHIFLRFEMRRNLITKKLPPRVMLSLGRIPSIGVQGSKNCCKTKGENIGMGYFTLTTLELFC